VLHGVVHGSGRHLNGEADAIPAELLDRRHLAIQANPIPTAAP
jgi:hypothetical protein